MIYLPPESKPLESQSDSWSPIASPSGNRQRTLIDDVLYKLADCREEREDAFRLIHDAYTKTGLMEPNTFGMRVTPFHLLPTTDVFLAYHENTPIYTMTLISDDEMGLPLEDVYESEVSARRIETGAYFAEVSCLASRQGYFSRSRMFQVFEQLVGLMFQSARENGVERLLIACHPRHARFYRRFLGFEQIGKERCYASVQDNPAVACEHDFAHLDKEGYKLYDHIYAHTFRRWELYRQPMLDDDREYFDEITELCKAYVPLAVA